MRVIFKDRNVLLAPTVAALGYFVDIFDLLLFALVRVRSLKDLLAPEIAAAQQKLMETARFTDAAAARAWHAASLTSTPAGAAAAPPAWSLAA